MAPVRAACLGLFSGIAGYRFGPGYNSQISHLLESAEFADSEVITESVLSGSN
jgi:hypothetical protein